MSLEHTKVRYFSQSGTSAYDEKTSCIQKPIEIYYFINPLCHESRSLESYLKKLAIEFGHYFTLRPLISKDFFTVNGSSSYPKEQLQLMTKLQTFNKKDHLSPWTIALAIKAAELQGKNAGRKFLQRIQQELPQNNVEHDDHALLFDFAQSADLDLGEFKKDLFSSAARKALLCDLKIANEMNVERAPTIVLINSLRDEQGVKMTGLYDYEIYTHVFLKTLKDTEVLRQSLPSLTDYISKQKSVTTGEISIIYDWSAKKAENELKKLTLQQIIKRKTSNSQVIWTYTGE